MNYRTLSFARTNGKHFLSNVKFDQIHSYNGLLLKNTLYNMRLVKDLGRQGKKFG